MGVVAWSNCNLHRFIIATFICPWPGLDLRKLSRTHDVAACVHGGVKWQIKLRIGDRSVNFFEVKFLWTAAKCEITIVRICEHK